eukprot:scaffold55128_cov78-Phaeocystis_antarctica.AAC.1
MAQGSKLLRPIYSYTHRPSSCATSTLIRRLVSIGSTASGAHAFTQSLLDIETAWIGFAAASLGDSVAHGLGSPVKCMIATAEASRTGGGSLQRVGMALYP